MKRALVTLTLTGISAGIVWFSSAPALAGPGPTPAIERAWAVAVDKSGNVYMSNGAAYVRRINPEGALSIYAGNGMTGFSGNGGASTSAELTAEGIAVDPNGNLLIAGGGAVRKVTPAKIISTVAGTGKPGFSGDGGLATAAQITAHGVAVDTSGNVYIAGDSVVRKVTPSGVISTFAGTGETGFSGDGGLATSARMSRLVNVAAGAGAVVYISDFDYERVRKVTPDGVIQTVAGTGERGFGGDGGPGNSARLNGPMGMTEDASGNLFIADGNNGRVRKLTPRGIITTVAGNGFVVRRIFRDTFSQFGGDGGPATSAWISFPRSVAFDGDGNLFIASVVQLRKVTPAGLITTVWDSYAGATAPKRAMQKPNASLHAASFVSVPAFLLLLISITCSRRERRTRLNGRRID